MSDILKAVLIVIISIVGIYLAYNIAFAFFFVGFCFKRENVEKKISKDGEPVPYLPSDRLWYEGIDKERITIQSKDKLTLVGYLIKNNSNKLAILSHGYRGRAYSTTKQAKMFYELGYNVLLVNNRAHDESQGHFFSMGILEREDLNRWIKKMVKRNPDYEIVLYGVSMGAHVTLRTLTKYKIDKNVLCAIVDCPYLTLYGQISHLLVSFKTGTIPPLVITIASGITSLFLRFSIFSSIRRKINQIDVPLLLIHGTSDTFVPYKNSVKIYNLLTNHIYKELQLFEGSDHRASINDNPEKYKEITENFLNKFVK